MMKMNKRGFELSLNMIIIVIIAFVFLGVVIALIRNWGGFIKDEIPKVFPPANALWQPTQDNPILFSPSQINVKRGENKVLTLQVYNYATNDVNCSINFNYVGEEADDVIKFRYSSANRDIPIGMVGEWSISISTPKTAMPNVYIYTSNINCGAFSKQSDLVIDVE